MKKKCLYLPIEIKPREFSSKVALAHEAASRGFRCYIGNKSSINTLLRQKKKRGGVYLYKGGMLGQDIESILDKCGSFMVLDEEMGPAITDWSRIGLRLATNTEKFIDRFFVIGDKAAQAARTSYPSLADRIVVSGWPKVDIWRSQLKDSLYANEVNKIRKKYGDFVLFSSDFGVLSSDGKERIVEQHRSAKGYDNTIDFSYKLPELIDAQIEEFEKFLALLHEIDGRLEMPLVIRPHPAEEQEIWHEVATNFKQISVVYEGEISPWLYSSRGILHRGCTSAVQAYMGCVRSGYIVPNGLPYRDGLPFALSEALSDVQEVVDFCSYRRREEGVKTFELKTPEYNDLNNTIAIGNLSACKLIIDEISKVDVEPEVDLARDKLLVLRLESSIKKVVRMLMKTLRSNKNEKFAVASEKQKMQDGVTCNEVQSLINNLSTENNIVVTEITDGLVCIQG